MYIGNHFMKYLVLLSLGFVSSLAMAKDMPIFDAHIHYSHDAVIQVPPKEAASLLRKAGLKKALISSSDDNGTQAIYKEAPDIVVRALRPYRLRGEISTWMYDPTVITYVESRLAKYKYEALGEFHAYGDDIETPVLQRMIALAEKYDLLLHAHSDADAVDRIFKTFPQARVLWAHSGFDRPEEIRETLRKHKNLWSDLAFRNDQASEGKVPDEWRAAFEEFPDRFMVGTDTFAPERWYYIGSHAEYTRGWLKDLPATIAKKIAYENAETMLSSKNEK